VTVQWTTDDIPGQHDRVAVVTGTEQAGAAIIPTAVMMVLVAPRSAKMLENIGSRLTLLIGYAFIFLGFLTMLLLWQETSRYWEVGWPTP